MPSSAVRFPTTDLRMNRMRGGLIGSLALHLLVILTLVFALPWLMRVPPPQPIEKIVAINLVRLGDKTAAPSSAERAPLPQEKAKEVAKSEPADAVPVVQTPPPQAAPRQAEEKSAPDMPIAAKPEQKPEIPKPVKASKPDRQLAAKQRQPSPADDLSARLDALARLRQPPPPVPPNPRQQDGSGSSNVTAASAARAQDATYSLKDFIRAQVERRWNLSVKTTKGDAWVVAIHIMLSPNGNISLAEIVDSPRYRSDSAYRDFALSARNAVLLSSPLTVPPGEYDIAKDIIIDFNSMQVLK